jgi:GxxExxY protein
VSLKSVIADCGVGDSTMLVHVSQSVYFSTQKREFTMEINDITGQIIDAAMKVHTVLGPGLLESAYEACLAHELRKRGLKVDIQLGLPIEYDGVQLDVGYRIDLLIEDSVIVELKAVSEIQPIHEAQLLSYLKLSKKKIGLLINFHVLRLKDGIKRMAN